MRRSLQQLMEDLRGQTVFIIGGGDSARHVDFELLQDQVVVCINDAFEYFPDATMIYWVDDSWASENHDNLKRHNCKHYFTSRHAQHVSYIRNEDPTTICNAAVLRRTGDFGYDSKVDCLMGNNSGVQVLNLVMNMRPDTIVLIGYDMKRNPESKRTHFHDKYRLPIQEKRIYNDMFLPSMNALADGFKKSNKDIRIVNTNSNSAIRCFEFGDYRDFIGEKK